jgi:Fic family protein
MTRVLGLADDQHFEWTAGVIKDLHYMMMEYDMDKAPGRWRTGVIYVVNEKGDTVYEGPNADDVPNLMAELVEQLRRDDRAPELVRAAMAHLNLVMIHPFKDGNGRMARCLQTLVLGRAGTVEPLFSSVEEFLGTNTGPYYDVLAKVGQGGWHPENDARPWVRFCLRAHHYQAQTFLRRTRESDRLMGILEEAVTRAGLPERTRLALFDAAQGFKVRNNTYRAAAEIEHQSASRDLKALVDAGFLVAEGERKARAYGASEVLVRLRQLADEKRTIPDPYIGEIEPPAMVSVTGTAATPAIVTGFPMIPSATGQKPPSEESRPDDRGKAD